MWDAISNWLSMVFSWETLLKLIGVAFVILLAYGMCKLLYKALVALFVLTIIAIGLAPIAVAIAGALVNPWFLVPCFIIGAGYYWIYFKIVGALLKK